MIRSMLAISAVLLGLAANRAAAVEFFGVDVTPLGGATATIDPLGELGIGNIGASGNDGWEMSATKSAAGGYKAKHGLSGATKREINPGLGGGPTGPLLTSTLS